MHKLIKLIKPCCSASHRGASRGSACRRLRAATWILAIQSCYFCLPLVQSGSQKCYCFYRISTQVGRRRRSDDKNNAPMHASKQLTSNLKMEQDTSINGSA
ncbi:hypothetical protein COEREDRAFT_7802 [Coemansia reversa NRRL 1564]|uniref:Uncharacterized protein n=1 Tax=Coemansia reversa (strain ATCC 12441 / NRRL 1564) TaxID=763665 RepID=A0A2G5BDE9_COERN|nr:hypothetical protein COEREDRAFT_7802 [Coemansia reversa NRRL 1564]|eukprot:PIA17035.1 hypothetical protein COEREDRAFT_7802 [Coemansia reversa NRRL 1564]